MRLLLAGLLSIALFGAPPSAKDCLGCHEVDLVKFEASKHASVGCFGCHTSITKLPHADKVAKVDCAGCHDGQVKAYAKSIHGLAKKGGMADSATCASCHGSPHLIMGATSPRSPRRTWPIPAAPATRTPSSSPATTTSPSPSRWRPTS